MRVTVSIAGADRDWPPHLDGGFIETLRNQLKHSGTPPSLEEVRRRLSKIPGNMTDDFITERRESGEPDDRGER